MRRFARVVKIPFRQEGKPMKSVAKSSRIILITLTALFTSVSAVAWEVGYDYPGGDYLGQFQNVGNADQCANICRENPNCAVFTWVRPGLQGNSGVCWLKSSQSNRVANNCCTSGVVRARRKDMCKWHVQGTTYECYCQNSQSGNWYRTNPPACPQQKPPPRYIDNQKVNCPPGQVFQDAAFGQGRCVQG